MEQTIIQIFNYILDFSQKLSDNIYNETLQEC